MKTQRHITPQWAAVKVIRGFVDEVLLFKSLEGASKIEKRWRSQINPDYDEIAVLEATVADEGSSQCRRRSDRNC